MPSRPLCGLKIDAEYRNEFSSEWEFFGALMMGIDVYIRAIPTNEIGGVLIPRRAAVSVWGVG